MQNFFSYQIIVDKLPKTEQCYKLKADVDDLSEIKKILKVPAVKSFSAEIHLQRLFSTRGICIKIVIHIPWPQKFLVQKKWIFT